MCYRALCYRALPEILLSSPGNFVDQYIENKSPSHYGILDMPRLRRGHTSRDMLYNIHGPLTTVSGNNSPDRVCFWSILLCLV